MADRGVTRTGKYRAGNIVRLCAPDKFWSPRLKSEVYQTKEERMQTKGDMDSVGCSRTVRTRQPVQWKRLRAAPVALLISVLLCCANGGCGGNGGGITGRYVTDGHPDAYLVLHQDGTFTHRGSLYASGWKEMTGEWKRRGDEIELYEYFIHVWGDRELGEEPIITLEKTGGRLVQRSGLMEDWVWVKQ